MAYISRNRMQSEEDYEGIRTDIGDVLSDDFEDDEDYDDCDDDSDDDMQEYIAEVEERVDRLKEITLSAVKKRDRLGKALAVSVGVNIITTAAAIALYCGSPKKFYDALWRREG